ncbi:NUDIX domain-containing protein [Candidatus Peregrinibacteria bacterium]|nr:NUDIX domain-containing protein [Candidatus Peregrinibacteria bacterium]
MKKRQEHSAGFVIFSYEGNERKYLLLHYPGGHIEFPKGHIEPGESEQEAAVRELFEETGIRHVEIIEGYKYSIEYEFFHAGFLIQKNVVFFLARTEESEIKISHEHKGSEWQNYENTLKKLTFENARELLRKAETYLNQIDL